MAVWRAALLLALLGACTSKPMSNESQAGDAGLQSMTFPHQSIRDVDIVFVIDDAPGMAPAQAKLLANLGAFTDTLKSAPAGYPNLHLGVISSDLGAGASTVPGCRAGGDGGVFQTAARGACATTGLPAGQSFISLIDGQPSYHPAKSLADVLGCLVPLGDSGCAFPHPLASVLRALGADGVLPPPENAGFLRPGAFLSIVLLTNQDDCSAPPDSELFDPTSKYVSDPLGPLTSFRCTEFGLSCGGAPPPRMTATALTGCQSAEDGKLLRVADVVARLKALKADPNRVLVAALSGPPNPVAVQLGAPGLPEDPSPWPSLVPACTSSNAGGAARPAVRVEEWVYAFGHNGVLENVCADDLGPALQHVAQSIVDVLGPPCLDGPIAKKVGPHGARPDCTITDYSAAIEPNTAGTLVPSCVDTGDVAACWTLTDNAACPNGKLLGFETPPGSPAVGTSSSVQCLVCADAGDSRCQ
jgi:hypothetical protein